MTLAVEAHVGVATHRGRNLEIGLPAGGARRQVGQGVHAAAVGGELRHLLAGDDVADFARFRLDPYGIGFDRNGLRGCAQLQIEVDACAITHVQHDVVLLADAEARGFGLNAEVTEWQGRRTDTGQNRWLWWFEPGRFRRGSP